MRILNLLATGHNGGIERLCVENSKITREDEFYVFAYSGGINKEILAANNKHVLDVSQIKSRYIKLKMIHEYCKKWEIDIMVIHHATPIFYAYGLFIKVLKLKPKVVCYAHTNYNDMQKENTKIKSCVNRYLISKCLKKCDAIISISKAVKKSIEEELNVRQKNILVYNGVDCKKFAIKSKVEIGDTLKIIYVGRLTKDKGVQNIFNILSKLKSNTFELTVVGDGSYVDELKELACKLKIHDKVNFLGDRTDVPELLSYHNVFMHFPICEEGFGLTIVEAMMAGLICISCDKGGIPEILTHEKNGYILDYNNFTETVKYIDRLFGNIRRNQCHHVIKEARNIDKDFDISIYGNNLRNVYESILSV